MPSLSIIPAAAVADARLTDGQLRVLCAIGTFTNRLGGNVWASVNTLAKASNLNPRTIQRALNALVDTGYIRVMPRPGRTHLYEVALDTPPTLESSGGDSGVTPPPTLESPKRSKERYNSTKYEKIINDPDFICAFDRIFTVYPKRPEPYPYVAFRRAVAEEAQKGNRLGDLLLAAERYRATVEREETEPRYVRSPMRFYAEDMWRQYVVATVYGRTREEWARSGQDVAEFDRLAAGEGDA